MTDVPLRITCSTCTANLRLLPPDVEVVSCRAGTVARYRCATCDAWAILTLGSAHLLALGKACYPVRYVYVPPPDRPFGWTPMGEDEVLAALAEMHAGLVTTHEDPV